MPNETPEHANYPRAMELLDGFMETRPPEKYREDAQMRAAQAVNRWLWKGATCNQAARLVEASLLDGHW
jgi:hypothetical protein